MKRDQNPQSGPLQVFNENQVEKISVYVRLGILIWSGAILTISYVELPESLKFPKQKLDPTFIASVFTGVAASFGVQTSKKERPGGLSKEEVEDLIINSPRSATKSTRSKSTKAPPVYQED